MGKPPVVGNSRGTRDMDGAYPVLVHNSKPLNEAGWVEINGVWFYNGRFYGRKDAQGILEPTRTEQRLVGRAKLHETTKEYSKGQYAAVVLAELDTIRMMMLNADDAKTVRKLGHEALERIYAFLK